uniref:Uncharacterized protein n=1 Tax=Fagus sylvatica TaxID=28930 RepID=A0A2N9FIF8_FAGSY
MVSIIVNRTYLNVAKYPVGIESRVKDINLLLSIGRNDIRMVGILGVGGIGKTTIAKAIYNLIAHQFEVSCFLANVRETSKQESGLVQLQETLLSEILRDARISKVGNVDRGINVIKHRLCSKRVLLILDDVDQLVQLETLAGKCDWFGLGSRIIITTRDKSLLTNHQVDFTYQVKEMDHSEALQLFSWNAFKRDKPVDEYAELTERAVHYAGGLPLALMVVGSDLYGSDMIQWESALDKYKRIPNKNIQEILKISYDRLDDNEKDIFLDIACFFKGKHANYVIKILDKCGFFPDIGIQVLIDKSLITIEEYNNLGMHDLLQEMGREIVRQESPEEPGERSRLWFHEDVRHVLEENTMKRLRLFINRNALFSGGPNYLSNELRLLEWPEYPLQSLPSNFHGKRLVVLKMRNNLFKGLHDGFKNLQNLTIMDFSNCEFLTEVPDLSKMPNLEELTLDNCTNLVEVHHSVGFLDKLKVLRFVECSNLRSFPRSLKLRSLVVLMLEDCSGNFPEIECKMRTKKFLKLSTSLQNGSIQQLQHLKRLHLNDCSKLVKFSKNAEDDIQSMPSIVSTKESEVSSSAELSIINDGSSSMLDLSGSSFVSLPSCMGGFLGLRCLKLDDCKQLQEILVLPPKMEEGHLEDHLFGIIFPGNKIPDWFCHHKENSTSDLCEIDINEPPHLDGEIIGMALLLFKEYGDVNLDVHVPTKRGRSDDDDDDDDDGNLESNLLVPHQKRYPSTMSFTVSDLNLG